MTQGFHVVGKLSKENMDTLTKNIVVYHIFQKMYDLHPIVVGVVAYYPVVGTSSCKDVTGFEASSW